MRLHQIEIENFGMFREKSVGLGDGRFHLLCGPNEAGKSTLLQLIRELMFGFAVRNPYAFADHEGEMAATAVAEMRDGTCLRFRRRKGRSNTVAGEIDGTGRTFDEAGMTRLLGNASAELYQNVFAFSLRELASGEESLKHVGLKEALYGAGLGGLANVQQALAAIQTEHQSLFTVRGQKPPINRLLAEIQADAAKLGQVMVKPRQYKDMCQQHDQCVETADRLRKTREQCFRHRSHVDRLTQALPLWQQLCQAEGELATLEAPEAFPLAAADDFRRCRQQHQQVCGEVATAESELAEIEADLAHIRLRPELVAEEAAIKKLFQQVAQVASCRRDIPLRQQEAEAGRNQLLTHLKELHPEWDLPHLERLRTKLPQRDRVEQLDGESADLHKRAEKLALQHRERMTKLDSSLHELDRLKAVQSAPELERLSQRAAQYQSDRDQANQFATELALLDNQIARLRQEAAGSLGIAGEAIESLPVPLASAVQEFTGQFARADADLRQAEREHRQITRDVARSRLELQQFDATQHVPDQQTLAAQRARRDEGWRLVRQAYIEGRPVESQVKQWLPTAAGSLPDQYEREVANADRLADDRQEKAELVGRREQIAQEAARHEKRLAEGEEELARCRAAKHRVEQAWQGMWVPAGVSPQSPETMIDWLRLRTQLCEKLQDRLHLEYRRQQYQQQLVAFEEELRAAVATEGNPADLLAQAEQRAQQAHDARVQKTRLERDAAAAREELEQLRGDQEELRQEQETWNRHWQDLLQEIGFPASWSTRLAAKMLAELADARAKHRSVQDLEERIEQMVATKTDFERQVARLCDSLAPDLQALPPEEATSRLNERLEEAQRAARQHAVHLTQRQRTEQRLKSRRATRDQLADRLAAIRGMAAAASDDQFEGMAAVALRRKQLGDEIETLRRDIGRISAGEDPSSFQAELAQSDADGLALALRQSKEELADVERQHERAVEQVALARKGVEDLEGQHLTNELAQKLESDRAELREAIEQWAPLVLAETILNEAIARFEREHQPAMLRDVERLFSELTRGRYVGLRRKLDEQGTLLVAEANGSSKEPGQLSTGTREQLYLAIRLAYARQYCRDNEPLPLVMDDVLVNFDDQRSDAALDLFVSLAEEIQVIFLTCHQDTIRRIQSRLPRMEPTMLG